MKLIVCLALALWLPVAALAQNDSVNLGNGRFLKESDDLFQTLWDNGRTWNVMAYAVDTDSAKAWKEANDRIMYKMGRLLITLAFDPSLMVRRPNGWKLANPSKYIEGELFFIGTGQSQSYRLQDGKFLLVATYDIRQDLFSLAYVRAKAKVKKRPPSA